MDFTECQFVILTCCHCILETFRESKHTKMSVAHHGIFNFWINVLKLEHSLYPSPPHTLMQLPAYVRKFCHATWPTWFVLLQTWNRTNMEIQMQNVKGGSTSLETSIRVPFPMICTIYSQFVACEIRQCRQYPKFVDAKLSLISDICLCALIKVVSAMDNLRRIHFSRLLCKTAPIYLFFSNLKIWDKTIIKIAKSCACVALSRWPRIRHRGDN